MNSTEHSWTDQVEQETASLARCGRCGLLRAQEPPGAEEPVVVMYGFLDREMRQVWTATLGECGPGPMAPGFPWSRPIPRGMGPHNY